MVKLLKPKYDDEEIGIMNFIEYQKLSRDPKVKEIIRIWKKVVDHVTGEELDRHLIRIMPIYHKDTLETLVDRYTKTFPEEVYGMLKEMDIDNYVMGKGWSDHKLMRSAGSLPTTLHRAIQYMWPDCWRGMKNTRKTMRKLYWVAPKLMVGDV